jgi:sorting nexin-1/2
MVGRWPGLIVPSLPPKKMIGGMEAEFVEQRRQELDQFMKRLARERHFWYSEELQVFIRAAGDKALSQLPKQPYFSMVEKFKNNFSELQGFEVTSEMREKISSFTA